MPPVRIVVLASDDTSAIQDQFDPKMSGAVPFTLLFSPTGDVLYQEQGEISMGKGCARRNSGQPATDDKDHPGQQSLLAAALLQ